jgi:hypothetical protein
VPASLVSTVFNPEVEKRAAEAIAAASGVGLLGCRV